MTRTLGTGGPGTSSIGLGCMGFSQGYGPADDEASLAALDTALDCGSTLLDTAQSYGSGHNEELVGRLLARRRGEAQVATKFGIVRGEHGVTLDARPDRVRGYCEASLRRLGVDVIDLYYLHRVDPQVPIAETVAAMAELVSAGLVRHLGVSEVTAEQLTAACAAHPIAAVQTEWSLLWRLPEIDIVPAARGAGVGIVAYSPLGRGLLTGALARDEIHTSDFRRGDPRFAGAELTANQQQVAQLRALAAEWELTPGQLALGWLLAAGPDVVAIPGTRSAERVRENAAARALSPDEVAAVERRLPASGWSGDRQSFAVPVTRRHLTTG